MRRFLTVLLLMAAISPVALAASEKKPNQNGITVAGTTQGNTGCMILEKHTPVKGKLLLAGVLYVRTEYRVLQSFDYKPARQKYTGEGQVKELNREAVKNKVKLVIVPSKYTAAQVAAARKLCGK